MSSQQTFKGNGYNLFVSYIEAFLGSGVTFRGFQSGFGLRPDLILFDHPDSKTTLAVPVDTLHLPQELARQRIHNKIAASLKAFAAGGD